MSMTCERSRALLSAYHDDALSPRQSARVRDHLATCAACREALDGYDRLYSCLRTAPATVPSDLRYNVYMRIAALETRSGGARVGPALWRTMRAAGGTAGLLAVLAALVFAIVDVNGARDHAGGAQLADPRAAGTAVSIMMGAVGRGGAAIAHLPPNEQTVVAPVRVIFKRSMIVSVGAARKAGKSGADVSVSGQALQVDRYGAPHSIVGFHALVLPRATVQRVAVDSPAPVPTVAPADGLVYLHLKTDAPFLPPLRRGNSPAEVYWHPFAPGADARLLVAPGPSTAQLFTGLTSGLDGRTVAYSALGTGVYGGIFSFRTNLPRPAQVLSVPNPTAPNTTGPLDYVRQVYPTTDGRLLYTLITSTTGTGDMHVSVDITTTRGTQVVAVTGDPWSDYAVSPDRRYLAWVQNPTGDQGFGTLYVVTLSAHPVTQTVGSGAHPVWSPDSRALLYTSDRPAGLWLWSVRGGVHRQLATLNPSGWPLIRNFTWAPNGQFVAYVATTIGRNGRSVVRLVNLATGTSWTAFTDRWIGPIAWVHGPVATPRPTIAARVGPGTSPVGRARTSTVRPYSNTSSPLDTLRSYYNAINRHDYRRAFSYVAFLPGDHPDFTVFASGYSDTQQDTITLVPARYLNAASFNATTCVGFELVAHHTDGRLVRYGGWYLLRSTAGQNPHFTGWKIVMSASHVDPNGRAVVPPQGSCAAASGRTAAATSAHGR